MSDAILEVTAVRKAFGGLVAVDDLAFSAERGEILGLIGPNGSGKTTMLNLISGALRCDDGAIRFKGKEISTLPTHRIARLGIGRTFQLVRVLAAMTCRDNVIAGLAFKPGRSHVTSPSEYLPLQGGGRSTQPEPKAEVAATGWGSLMQVPTRYFQRRPPPASPGQEPGSATSPFQGEVLAAALPHAIAQGSRARPPRGPSWRAAAAERAEALLARVGLSGKAELTADQLTYVDQKRLELARALALAPDLLLLDEWLAGLNPSELLAGIALVRSLRQDGLTIILVEHVMDAIRSLCDRCIVMNAGRKIAEGPPPHVLADAQVVRAYLGDADA